MFKLYHEVKPSKKGDYFFVFAVEEPVMGQRENMDPGFMWNTKEPIAWNILLAHFQCGVTFSSSVAPTLHLIECFCQTLSLKGTLKGKMIFLVLANFSFKIPKSPHSPREDAC